MKLRPIKPGPAAVAGTLLLLLCLAEGLHTHSTLDISRRLEWITYDLRCRIAARFPGPAATNLAAVFIDDTSLEVINRSLQFNWPWPRELHGLALRRLKEQGAKRVAFDILFAELHPNSRSDSAFAANLRQTGNALLASFGETTNNVWHAIPPADLFRTNALGMGHATSDKDADGVLRRALPYKEDTRFGRLWHLGILLAAGELELDLQRAEVQPDRIILRSPKGITRTIPLDSEGYFFIDWSLAWNDPRLTIQEFERVIARGDGSPAEKSSPFRDKLVVIGSIGAGNNISDVGPTPASKETYLVSKHWNVANSLITGRFIQRTPIPLNLLVLLLLGAFSALVTWWFGVLRASVIIVIAAVLYGLVAVWLFVEFRWWLPVVLPVFGGLMLTHVTAVTYRLVFEERESRRVREIFSRLVAPEVVTELLASKDLHLGGARRRITVFFADVRGFTEMTDSGQARAEEFVRQHNLTPEQAEAYFDQHARDTLETVNNYLAIIADQVKKHGGTLDKYIGDCVMAFWGAPAANDRHAVACVRAAIDAQRAIYELNQKRFARNKEIEAENVRRAAAGQPPAPLLPLLALGTGINTGTAVVGLMGSDAHILNYTVFGREVNIASRLEGVSGRGRIFISESTFQDLQRLDPELASTCSAQAPQMLKGIQGTVKIYEVPWKTSTAANAPKTAPVLPAATPAATQTTPPKAV